MAMVYVAATGKYVRYPDPSRSSFKLQAPREFQIYLAAVCMRISLRIHVILSTTTSISLSPDVIRLSVLTTIALEP